MQFADTPCEAGKPYLGLWVHTRQVLEELGYDEAAIARLKDAGAIGLPGDEYAEAKEGGRLNRCHLAADRA